MFYKKRIWKWKGLTPHGDIRKGRLLATSFIDAQYQLKHQGISIQRLRNSIVFGSRTGPEGWALRLNLLGNLLGAGIGLLEALYQQTESSSNDTDFLFWAGLYQQVSQGTSLSSALKTSGLERYTPLVSQLISIGEHSGRLSDTLQQLGQQLEQHALLKRRVVSPIRYPALLLMITGIIMIVMLIEVIPIFSTLYSQNKDSLPLLTQVLFSLSHYLRYAPYQCAFSGLFLLSVSVFVWQYRHKWIYRLPLFGSLITRAEKIAILDSLGLAQENGILLDKSLTLLATPHCRVDLANIALQLGEGHSLSSVMRKMSVFGPLLGTMVANGEQSGRLAEALYQASRFEHQQLERQLAYIDVILEPLLMLILSMILGTLVLALYLPIFELGQHL